MFTWRRHLLDWVRTEGYFDTPVGRKYLWVRQCYIFAPGIIGLLLRKQRVVMKFYLRDEPPSKYWKIDLSGNIYYVSRRDPHRGESMYTFTTNPWRKWKWNLEKLREYTINRLMIPWV